MPTIYREQILRGDDWLETFDVTKIDNGMERAELNIRQSVPGGRLLLLLLALGFEAGPGRAATLVQDFYVPLPEAQVYQANNTIVAGTGSAIFSTISIHVVTDGTVIYYDQWEDGYETDLNNPTNTTTLIWGDGNDAHGIPPGMAHNPLGLPGGTIITLTNAVVTQPRNTSIIQYDGRDRIGATKPIVVTRAHWPSATGTVIAGAVSVLSTAEWGTNYTSPVGQNMTNGLMGYVGMFVQAGQNNTAVTIDPTGTNGVGVTNIVLNQGESYLYNGGILKGGRATASKPVQADLVIGHKNVSYAVDWFTLYPVSSWGPNYYTPVGSSVSGNPAYVYLYNPGTNNLNIKVATKVGVTTVTVPGTNGVTQYTMPASSGASFIATNGQNFYAICTVNAAPSSDTAYNWGFSLVPTLALTTEEDVGWAPGSSDGTVSGSPVWVTALNPTTLYVVYGDSTNSLTDPTGHKYSTNFAVSAYQSLKIYNPSKNQTGMRIYTLDGALITAAWGEDADKAAAGNPYIDAGYTVLPFPVPTLDKSAINLTHPGATLVASNDVVQYTVTIANKNLVPLENVVVYDQPSVRMRYVANSTTNFTSVSTNAVPDKAGGVFPLISPGYTNAIIQARGTIKFTYQFTVTNVNGTISNTVTIPSSIFASGLQVSLTADSEVTPTNAYAVPAVNFTDTNGVATNAYPVGGSIYVTVTNAAANLATNATDTIQVMIADVTTGDLEPLNLTETGTNSGVFRNITGLPVSATAGLYPNDGILNGSPGDALTATYIDASGAIYSTNATLTSAGGGGGGGGGGGSGTAFALTKQLYLNQATNGASITTNGLNRYDPVHYGYSLGLQAGPVTAGGYNSWQYRKTITLDHTKVPNTDQLSFPVLISLSSDSGLSAHALSSGNDILFTSGDGVTRIPYERESYSNGTLVAWVQVPTVSHTADTVIYMYYGNSGATDQQQATNVWGSNFKNVWHLTETSGATLHDSTSTGNTATNQGVAALGAAGQMGRGVTLNTNVSGTGYLSTTMNYSNPNPYTVSIWFKTTNSAGHKIFGLETLQTGTTSANYDRMFYVNASGKLVGGMYDSSGSGTRVTLTSSATVTNNIWHYVALTFTNTTLTCYLDGTSLGTATVTTPQTYTAGYWRMGSYQLGGSPGSWPSSTNGYLVGSIDEARYSASARSADWIATEYNNQNSPSTFYSLGVETVNVGANEVTFTQAPAFANNFMMPSNSTLYITNFITLTNGSFTANPNVTATLQTNGVDWLTLTSPTYNSGTGINTNLAWSGVLGTNVTLPAGAVITCVISNNVSDAAFYVNYGSTNMPSVILLPASPSTVVSISSFGIYDAPYPGGNPVSAPVAGSALYVRATVSDPFGNYDITSLGLQFTAPGGGVTSANASVVSTSTTNEILEYQWTGTTAVGNYSVVATANEGTEGITATATKTLTTMFLDQGTPTTTAFIQPGNGAVTASYTATSNGCVRVQDLSANTNPAVMDSVVVTVTSSAGGSITLTLYETGNATGAFTNCFGTTTNISGANGSTLYAPVGAILTASYSSITSPAYPSSASATIESPPGAPPAPAAALSKTIVSPTSGQVLLGQPVTYNLQVFNTGNTNLYNLVVTDSYPSQLTYTNASPAPAITNTVSRLLIWTNLGPLAPGQSTNLSVTFVTSATGSTTNNAWVGGGGAALTTNSAAISVSQPGLSVTKTLLSPGSQPLAVGSTAVFRIVITNTGTTTITNLPLEDYFSGVCFQYVTSTIPASASGYGSLVWTNLAPTNGLAANGVLTNDVTMLVTGQGSPAYNTATADYAVDGLGNAVPASSSIIGVTNATAAINGYVYYDANHNGTNDPGDTGLSGVTVQLYASSNGVAGALLQIASTAANGYYELLNLSTGAYVVVESVLPGYVASSPVNLPVNVTNLTVYTNANFFEYQPAATNYSTISGKVGNDTNGFGTNYVGGLNNVTIDLIQDLNSNGVVNAGEPVVRSTLTDTNGSYSFGVIPPGRYIIRETDLYGYYSTGNSQYPQGTNANTLVFTATNGIVSSTNNFFDRQLPITVNDAVTAFNRLSLTIYPLANDISPNGDPLAIASAQSTGGIVAINPGGTNLTFTPTNPGAVSITYTVNDSHGGTNSASVAVTVLANATTMTSPVSQVQLYTNETVTVTLRLTNASILDLTLDRFVDTMPAGFVYVTGSSTFNGVSMLDPTNVSQVLTWSQTAVVPAGASRDFVFQTIPTIPGYATNACVAYAQNVPIDTTPDILDNAPATEIVRALIVPTAVNDSGSLLEDTPLVVSAPGTLANDIEPNGFTLTVVSYTQPAHGSVTVNANGSYTYTPATNYNGGDSFTYTLTNGNARASTATVNLTVTAVNDPPTLNAISNLTTNENAGLQTVNLSGITVGPTNEAGQTLMITATSSDPSVVPDPTVNYTSPGATGTLTFTPLAHAFGTATITVVVKDSGGTADGGVDSVTNTFTVTFNAVNDPPGFMKGADQTVLEDATAQSVANWATDISVGPANESSQTVAFHVSNDNNNLFSVQPAVSPVGTLTYTPATNANGSATVTIYAQDSGGTANGGIDVSATNTFTITVTPVNDPPGFSVSTSHVVVLEDAGAQTNANFLTDISVGPTNESAQTLQFFVSNNNSNLFVVQPWLATNGTLTFAVATNRFGVATVTVYAQDDGGTANGGADTSPVQTFDITITPVNDPPTLDVINNLSLVENWNLQTVNLTGITAGPTNESSQTLTILAVSDNPSLVPNPTVNYTNPGAAGTLTLAPATNSFGMANITVIVHDDGGTANGGVDSHTNTFTVTLQGLTNYWYGGSNLIVNVFDAGGGPGAGYSQTNYLGVLEVLATGTNPFAIKLDSFNGGAPGPAANFDNDSNYVWTIATTTRGVIGLTTNQFIVDTGAFTNDLAGGTFGVVLSDDGKSVNLIFTPNHSPVANPVNYNRDWGTFLRIPLTNLLANATDPDGDPVALVTIGISTNGSLVGTVGKYIVIAPTNNIFESFTYVVRDVRSYRPGDVVRTATNSFTVTVTYAYGQAKSITANGSNAVVNFAGVPGHYYDVERTTNLVSPAWTVLGTTSVPPKGVWQFVDTNPPSGGAFYRTRQH
jgi:uncharacterized repeat protein (TIGR01451 family)